MTKFVAPTRFEFGALPYFRKEDKAATAVPVPPERLAIYHCSKLKSCTPDIFAAHLPWRNVPSLLDPSAPASLLPPPQTMLPRTGRFPFLGGGNSLRVSPGLCSPNRASALAIHNSRQRRLA